MIIFGNICLCVAAFFYFVPLLKMLNTTPNLNGTYAGVGILFSVFLGTVPLSLCLTSTLFAATARGGFDWLFAARPSQYLAVCVASAVMTTATGFSLLGKFVTAAEMPASVRWLSVWAAHFVPLVTMIFCLRVLNPNFTQWIPVTPVRIIFILAVAVSLLASVGWLVEKCFPKSNPQAALNATSSHAESAGADADTENQK